MVHCRAFRVRRKVVAAASSAAAAVAAAAAMSLVALSACGSSSPSPSGGGSTPTVADPLAGLSGDQVVDKAVAELKAAPSFTMTGTVTDSGGTYNVNLSYKHGSGCKGTVAQPGKGSFAMVVIGTTAWVKPDDAFWKANAGSQAPAAISLLSGRYLKGSTSNANVASLTKLCDVTSLSSALTQATGVAKGRLPPWPASGCCPWSTRPRGAPCT